MWRWVFRVSKQDSEIRVCICGVLAAVVNSFFGRSVALVLFQVHEPSPNRHQFNADEDRGKNQQLQSVISNVQPKPKPT